MGFNRGRNELLHPPLQDRPDVADTSVSRLLAGPSMSVPSGRETLLVDIFESRTAFLIIKERLLFFSQAEHLRPGILSAIPGRLS
jgi:hypothetical protein